MFSPESSIKWANRYDDVGGGVGEGGGWSGVRKRRWGGHHNQTMLNLPLSKRHLMNVSSFCLELGRSDVCVPETWATVPRRRPRRGQPHLAWPQVQSGEATRTFMHKCLLHTLNGCDPDGFLLLMQYQWDPLSASQPQPRQKGPHHLFPSSVLPSTKNQWKFKQTPQGQMKRHWSGLGANNNSKRYLLLCVHYVYHQVQLNEVASDFPNLILLLLLLFVISLVRHVLCLSCNVPIAGLNM